MTEREQIVRARVEPCVQTRYEHDPGQPGPPWPLTSAEVEVFADELAEVAVHDDRDPFDPAVRRWRAEFRRRTR